MGGGERVKVLKPGKVPVGWWWSVVNVCDSCGCRYRFEDGDTFTPVDDQRDGEFVTSDCPTCGDLVSTDRPSER